MITELGKVLRRMRIDYGELLKDMAEKLNITPSYLSSIENGKKRPTREWIDKLADVYNLSPSQRQDLKTAYFETINEVSISLDGASTQTMELGLVFARRFRNLSSKQMKSIVTILNNDKEDKKEDE